MSLLEIPGPDAAVGEIRDLYQGFLDSVGMIPPPLLMLGTSPGLQSIQAQVIRYYRERSNLSPLLMGLVRYLTAAALGMPSCVAFNAKVLQAQGLSREQIDGLMESPSAAPLDERDGWLLALAVKAVRAPDTISESHIAKLRDLGWSDADILDALYLASMMVGLGTVMRALKFHGQDGDAH
ncbi:MAG: hypothetical protein JSV00_01745 [bacterium]|nr:MAG: hypothetical protein JSV00_01745 [bacterium]